jgi:hypothetical protein
VHPPVQPSNREFGDGSSVSVTLLPESNEAEHVPGQSMPAGVLTMRPAALPVIDAETTNDVTLNAALTVTASVIVTLQVVVDVALQAPPQPEKLASFELTAVNATTEP